MSNLVGLRETDTCYEATATVVAAAENLAVSHGYKSRALNWSEVHWNFKARLLMETAYHRHCAEHGDVPEMLTRWQEAEQRMRKLYEG